ncbi:MAG: nitrogen fixation protein NifZ [Psychromonas sp.]|jgi:nitrogen fixation protein NifZ|uniref:nitrogen fixation protein NifZ n=1 Tax=Psychromonas sp. TaxID=1884585 RepID=UPI0039E65B58
MEAIFDFGDQVRVIKNIRNDGTFMGSTRGALLIRRGNLGYIKGVGKFLQDQVIYEVDFIDQGVTVGCRESELIDLTTPWIDRLFERGDRVTVQQSLSSCGKIVVTRGASGQVLGIESKKAPLSYRILFEQQNGLDNNSWIVPESALKIEQAAASLLSVGRKSC